jgi:glycogen(starch) synthase
VPQTDPLQASVEVEELEPKDPPLIATIKSMNDRGIGTLYGRWLIEGAPRVLLFDTGSAYRFLNEWKGDLWNIAGIPGPDGDHESNEAIVFGYLIAWFLGEVCLFVIYTTLLTVVVRLPRYEASRYCTFP